MSDGPSKYQEMRDAVARAVADWSKYQERSYKNAAKLVNGFVKFCEIPDGQFRFVPLREELEDGVTHSIVGATHYDNDSYWHTGLAFTLANFNMTVEFCVKEEDGKLIAKAFRDDEPRELDLDNEAARNEFYNGIVKGITGHFQYPMARDMSRKQIGFAFTGTPENDQAAR